MIERKITESTSAEDIGSENGMYAMARTMSCRSYDTTDYSGGGNSWDNENDSDGNEDYNDYGEQENTDNTDTGSDYNTTPDNNSGEYENPSDDDTGNNNNTTPDDNSGEYEDPDDDDTGNNNNTTPENNDGQQGDVGNGDTGSGTNATPSGEHKDPNNKDTESNTNTTPNGEHKDPNNKDTESDTNTTPSGEHKDPSNNDIAGTTTTTIVTPPSTILVESITVIPSTIKLTLDATYELPILPNTFTGVNGSEPLSNLIASTVPANATEKKVSWISFDSDIITVETGWYNGERYQTLKVVGNGTAKLYAYDWNENGKRGECTVYVDPRWPVYPKPTINSRESWGARDVVSDRLVARTSEPKIIVFHHTADLFSSTNISDIIAEIKETQNEHIDGRGKCDIAYHFVIDPAGGIWQGAEIDDYQRGHATGHFNDIGVVILGDFEERFLVNPNPNTLNNNQKNAMKELSKWLCYKYNLPIDKELGVSPITTHRSVDTDTVCPGANAALWIENDLKDYINSWHP